MIVDVAERLQNVQEYYFSKKLEQIAQMRAKGIDVISLGIGSPDLVPPVEALDAGADAIRDPKNHGYASYRSTPELRTAMADWYRSCYGVTLDPGKEILPLLGSKEGILYLSMAILNPGDAVLVPNPGYPAYASVAELLGVKVIYYDLSEQNHWLPDLEKLEMQDLGRVKLMWVNYPHMPTGTSCDQSFFTGLVGFAKKKRILICNDNPYGLVLNRDPPHSLLKADPELEVSAELNSLSKSFNMAGWRVGMFLGASDLIDAVLRVKSQVDSGMFLGIQKAAIQALNVKPEWHEARNKIYEKRRNLVWEIFDLLKFSYSRHQVGLFVWAKAPDSVNVVSEYLDKILEEAHVFLTPGMIFGSNGNRYARASLCASEAVLQNAVQRIKDWVK